MILYRETEDSRNRANDRRVRCISQNFLDSILQCVIAGKEVSTEALRQKRVRLTLGKRSVGTEPQCLQGVRIESPSLRRLLEQCTTWFQQKWSREVQCSSH